MDGSTEQLAWYFDHPNEIIGDWITIKYFSLTKDRVPRFPIAIHKRSRT